MKKFILFIFCIGFFSSSFGQEKVKDKYRTGIRYFSTQKYLIKAYGFFKREYKVKPYDYELLYYKSATLFAQKPRNTKEVIQGFTKYIKQVPDDPRGYFRRGVALLYYGQLDFAIEDLEKSLEINPFLYENYYFLGIAYGRKSLARGKIDLSYVKALENFALFDKLAKRRDKGYYGKFSNYKVSIKYLRVYHDDNEGYSNNYSDPSTLGPFDFSMPKTVFHSDTIQYKNLHGRSLLSYCGIVLLENWNNKIIEGVEDSIPFKKMKMYRYFSEIKDIEMDSISYQIHVYNSITKKIRNRSWLEADNLIFIKQENKFELTLSKRFSELKYNDVVAFSNIKVFDENKEFIKHPDMTFRIDIDMKQYKEFQYWRI